MNFDIPYRPPTRRTGQYVWLAVASATISILVFIAAAWQLYLAPPADFPAGQSIAVPAGASVGSIGSQLVDAHIIRSLFAFKVLVRLLGVHGISSGSYVFATPTNLFTVLHRLEAGVSGIPAVRVTFPEGSTVRDMATVLQKVPGFDAQEFYRLGSPHEGYLFPDTYFVSSVSTADSLISQMQDEFQAKSAVLAPGIMRTKHSLADVVTLASILEREAKTTEDRRIIAGILWKRIALGMPLQVDAAFGYIHGQDAYTPTAADLTADSPYNTYTHTGLPPGPIANPGIDALMDAVTPTQSNYLYYLTGTDGQMHYAATLAEHAANRTKYL